MSRRFFKRIFAWIVCLCMLVAYMPVASAAELAITTQPKSVSVASGETAKVSVKATGDGLKYQWYYANKGSSTFAKASIASATYSVEMNSTRAGRQVYCVVSDSAGNKVKSNTATLNMAAALRIVTQPKNATVANGETAKVTVKAEGEGLKYQWYYANKGSSTFAKASITAATYSVEMNSTRAGRKVYCVVTDSAGNKVQSNTVTLGMETGLRITQQPTNVTVANGETAKVTVKAEGEGLKYQWYYANKGSSTFAKASITAATYSVEMNSTRAGRKVYCVVTDSAGNKVQSNTVMLGMEMGVRITQQPSDTEVAAGKTAKVTVKAEGEELKYQWYYANKGSNTFTKASITTATYSVGMNSSRDGRRIYCVVTDANGNKVTSDTVTLSMIVALEITQQPTDATVKNGVMAEVTVTATGEDLKYQWYYANKGSSRFSKASITSATYSVEMNSSRDGRRIYCVITDPAGNQVVSDTVTLSMEIEIPEGLEYAIIDGEMTITGYTGNAKELAIPKEINEYPVRVIGESAFKANVELESIILPEELTRIEKYAFTGCSGLKSIAFPDKLTTIGRDAFMGSGVTEVVIPSTLTDVGSGLFAFCTWLTKATFAEGTTIIPKAIFENCTALTSVIIPSTVKEIGGGAFINCPSLTNVDLPDGLTTIGNEAFLACSSLTNVDLPDGLTTIGNCAFAECSSLSSLTIPKSVTTILADYGLPFDANTKLLVYFRSAAHQWCEEKYSNYEIIDPPPALTIVTQPVGATVDEGQTATVTVEAIGLDVEFLWYIKVPGADEYSATENTTAIYSVTMTKELDGAQVYCALKDQLGAECVTDTVTLIMIPAPTPLAILQQPQDVCVRLGEMAETSVVAQGDDVTYQWYYANKGSATFSKASITSETYSVEMTKARDGRRIYCVITDKHGNSLQSQTVTLIALNVPDGLIYNIGDGQVTITGYTGSATKLEIPAEIAGYPVRIIAANAFANCTGLTGVVIPESVIAIGEAAFSGCTGLTSMTLPGGVTAIEASTFENCTGLASVRVPNGITVIRARAFKNCTSLTDMTTYGEAVLAAAE